MASSKSQCLGLGVFVILFSQVFSHTLAQAEATNPAEVEYSDKLILRGFTFYGFHGYAEEERKLGQKFLVDIDAWVDLKPAGKSGNTSDAVDYLKIYKVAKEVLEGPAFNILEHVVEKIATTVLTNHKKISAVRVKVVEPNVAIQDPIKYIGVEILRRRSDLLE
ncbi:dihydroneopterin aldolase 2-like [Lotus japonicus]|uniref:7,8-dihydroneopterin aldolase n=1 Tax=Lotus japonicus TaxID=34305 RepID=I3SC22_LOTJA|nr:dihydroneopterin aldolase 2-like [Lotus japonicus]XP_057434251.1 dihydroneopterin aldolase 2-like [Lotus japonicus]AFK37814.1 unknown [Lotus japonicus]